MRIRWPALLAEALRDFLGATQLLAAGQQPIAIALGPAVILRVGKLHIVRAQFARAMFEDLLDVVNVEPVQAPR